MKIKITFFICFFAIFSLNAQEEQQFVEITGTVYKPKRVIKKIIDDLSKEPKCFENDTGLDTKQHYLSFSYHPKTDKFYLIAQSSANTIKESHIDLNNLNFSGIFYHKKYLVFLSFDSEIVNKTKKFFRITGKSIKIKVPVTKLSDPFCSSIFEIEGCDFKLSDSSESWNIITY